MDAKLDFKAKASPKVGSITSHTAKGGDVKIFNAKLDFKEKASPKVGSTDNLAHTPKGGDKKIFSQKLDFKEKASSKVGSTELLHHKPGGGTLCAFSKPSFPYLTIFHSLCMVTGDKKIVSEAIPYSHPKSFMGGSNSSLFHKRPGVSK